jgi:plasmid stabilization system protein ParE
MSGFVLTPLATADIFHIWTYIAHHNQDAADLVEQAIFDAVPFLQPPPCAVIAALTLQHVHFVSGR